MGEEIQGKWVDKRTGKTIFVRDAIMQANDKGEDEMIITSSIGIIPLNVFGQYYIKVSDEDYGQQGVLPEVSKENLNAAINQGIDNGLQIKQEKTQQEKILETPIHNGKTVEQKSTAKVETIEQIKEPSIAPKSMNYSLIEKVMNKYQNAITITFEANPDEWPKSELEMLVNTFDVSTEEICNYIIDKYLNKETLIIPFKEYLATILEIDK